jgi:hypothetical protein
MTSKSAAAAALCQRLQGSNCTMIAPLPCHRIAVYPIYDRVNASLLTEAGGNT